MADAAYWIEVGWNLLLVAFLVFLNGFFVATEFAIVKLRETQLHDVKGPRKVAAVHLVTHLDAYLSACQLGITIASLGLGWIGEPAVSHLLVEPLIGRWVADPGTVRTISFVIAFLLITALHIVVGEMAPKTIAIRHAKATTLSVALPMRLFRKVFGPMIWALNGSANLLLRAVGVQPAGKEQDDAHTAEEMQILLARFSSTERTTKRSAEIASRVFSLQDLTVRDIMTPRDRMVYLDISLPFAENLKVVEENPHTRYPITDGGVDSILGFVHIRDVFSAAKSNPPKPLENLTRDLHVAPTLQPVARALLEMLEKRKQMAVVVNEYGVTAGLVTLEDIFEELVGEITGEFDRSDSRLRVVAPGNYMVDATLPIHELQLVLREPLEHTAASSLGGLLIERLGRIPRKGEKVLIGQYAYFIREADKSRVRMVEIQRVTTAAAPPADARP